MDMTAKEHLFTFMKVLWKMQTLQFDYPSHAKTSYLMWHTVGFVSFVILGRIHRFDQLVETSRCCGKQKYDDSEKFCCEKTKRLFTYEPEGSWEGMAPS